MSEKLNSFFEIQGMLDYCYDEYGVISMEKINNKSDLLDTFYWLHLNENEPIKIYHSYFREWKNYKKEVLGELSPLENIKYHYSDVMAYVEINAQNVGVVTGHIHELKVYCVGVLVPNSPKGGYIVKYFLPYEVEKSVSYGEKYNC